MLLVGVGRLDSGLGWCGMCYQFIKLFIYFYFKLIFIIIVFNYVFIYVKVGSTCHVIKVNRLLDGVEGMRQSGSPNLGQEMKVGHFEFWGEEGERGKVGFD